MASVDDGLGLLERIFRKGQPRFRAMARTCARMQACSDTAKAEGWLISVLKRMESDYEQYAWLPMQSGIVLYTAGMVDFQ